MRKASKEFSKGLLKYNTDFIQFPFSGRSLDWFGSFWSTNDIRSLKIIYDCKNSVFFYSAL